MDLSAQIIANAPIKYYGLTLDDVEDGQVAMRLKDCHDLKEVQILTFDGTLVNATIVKTEMHKDGKEIIKDGKKITTKPCRKVFKLDRPFVKGVLAAFSKDFKLSDFQLYSWDTRKTVKEDFEKVYDGKRIETLSMPRKEDRPEYVFNEHGRLFVGLPKNLDATKGFDNFNDPKNDRESPCRTYENKTIIKVYCSRYSIIGKPVFLDYFFSNFKNIGYFDGYYDKILWNFKEFGGLIGSIEVNNFKYDILIGDGQITFYDKKINIKTNYDSILTNHRLSLFDMLNSNFIKKLRN